MNFNCKHCGLCIDKDINAAKSILKRMSDSEITLYTSYKRVKEILLSRLEESVCSTDITDPTKTLEPVVFDRSIRERNIKELKFA